MCFLQHKTIYILSPQSWGNMFLSKHHYAIALAESGNKVFFINPPNDPLPAKQVVVKPSGVHENLFIVNHRLSFPYRLKFHALPVFHWLMRGHIKKLLKKLGMPGIVWSFDLGYIYPFRHFPAECIKVFHPVDEPSAGIAIAAAGGADIIFSVTQEILDQYQHLPVPRHFINHGLAAEFMDSATSTGLPGTPLRVGYSGNLLREDLDREIFSRIVEENPDVQFECWGAYRLNDSNIGGSANDEQRIFIERLSANKNIALHGAVPVKKLAGELNRMDAFLICYDVQKDQSKGTNYHKIMEYLSTGKVIVSNNVTTYKNRAELVQMVANRQTNEELPDLFKKVVSNIEHYNNPEMMDCRRQFAFGNTYLRQVERIGLYLKCLDKKA